MYPGWSGVIPVYYHDIRYKFRQHTVLQSYHGSKKKVMEFDPVRESLYFIRRQGGNVVSQEVWDKL